MTTVYNDLQSVYNDLQSVYNDLQSVYNDLQAFLNWFTLNNYLQSIYHHHTINVHMINNHLQPFTIIYNCSTNIVKQLQPNYNQLQPFNKQLQAIYNHLQLNYNWSTMDVEITTIYNTFSTIDLQRHLFTIKLQSLLGRS